MCCEFIYSSCRTRDSTGTKSNCDTESKSSGQAHTAFSKRHLLLSKYFKRYTCYHVNFYSCRSLLLSVTIDLSLDKRRQTYSSSSLPILNRLTNYAVGYFTFFAVMETIGRLLLVFYLHYKTKIISCFCRISLKT